MHFHLDAGLYDGAMRSADTHPEAHRFYIDMLRRMSPSRRFERGMQHSEEVWLWAAAGIRSRHPDYDDDTVEWAIKRMRLKNDDLFRRVWPTAPLVAP